MSCVQIFGNIVFVIRYDGSSERCRWKYETFYIRTKETYFIRTEHNDYYSGSTILSGFAPYKLQSRGALHSRITKEYGIFKQKEVDKRNILLLSRHILDNAVDSHICAKDDIIPNIANLLKQCMLRNMKSVYYHVDGETRFP